MEAETQVQKRPGGRSSEVSDRVGQAVAELLAAGGYAAVTYHAVAEAAQTGRATLYRRWPTRAALTLFGISHVVSEKVMIHDKGTLALDLAATLHDIASFIASPLGRASIAAAIEVGVSHLQSSFWRARRQEVEKMFDRARVRGEISASADVRTVFAMASGALYFSAIVAAEPADDGFIDRVTGHAIEMLREGRHAIV